MRISSECSLIVASSLMLLAACGDPRAVPSIEFDVDRSPAEMVCFPTTVECTLGGTRASSDPAFLPFTIRSNIDEDTEIEFILETNSIFSRLDAREMPLTAGGVATNAVHLSDDVASDVSGTVRVRPIDSRFASDEIRLHVHAAYAHQ